jgi:hypothetical protein
MQAAQIEAQTSSGAEAKIHTFLTSNVNGVFGLLQDPIALLLRKCSAAFICC